MATRLSSINIHRVKRIDIRRNADVYGHSLVIEFYSEENDISPDGYVAFYGGSEKQIPLTIHHEPCTISYGDDTK